MFPLKNYSCLWKISAKKVTWSFSKIHALNGFNRKTYNIDRPIFFMNKFKILQSLVAWLLYLVELQWFASRFSTKFLRPDKFFGELTTKLGKYHFLCLSNSVQVFLKINRQGWDSDPGKQNILNSLSTPYPLGQLVRPEVNQSIIGKMIRTIESLEPSCLASKRVGFLLKKKQIKPLFDQQ